MESFEGGKDPNRGGDGPLRITRSRADHPFYETFLRAGEAYGLAVARDYNSADIEGLHITQATIADGRRQSTAVAYLHPAARRPNLTVLTGWRADRVELEGGRATGVALRRGATKAVLRAGREVILSAGAIGTPHLMQLSGIGAADRLRAAGVTVSHCLPGVGENLQDHFVASLTFRAQGSRSIASDLALWNRPRIGLEWLLTRKGLGATSFFEVGAFFRGGPDVSYANLQHEFLPFLADFQAGRVRIDHGYQYFLSQMRPKSRGWLRLRSADPDAHPRSSSTTSTIPPTPRRCWKGSPGPATSPARRRGRRSVGWRSRRDPTCARRRRRSPGCARSAIPSTTRSAPAEWGMTLWP